MATRNIVPRATGEGSLGTETKKWGNIYADNLHSSNPLPIANGGTGATTVAGARNALGLGNTTGALPIANGGTGATNAEQARTNLGIKDIATYDVLPIANGGTGATNASDARTNLGLGSVAIENTLPISKGGTGATTAKQARENLEVEPIGTIYAFAGNNIPTGYLPCNGSAISRTTYADLFAVIGTTYGSGDGSTTFNLPNLTDKFIQGSSAAGQYIDAGLPNITASKVLRAAQDNMMGNGWDGALGHDFAASDTKWYNSIAYTSNSTQNNSILKFDASKSNSIYGASSTVQPPAVTMRYIIKY